MADTRPYARVRPGLWYDQRSGKNVNLNVPRARSILRRYGFDVEATGPANDRLLDAWKTYRKAADSGTYSPHEASSDWNSGAGARSRSTGKGGKPVVGGSASEMVSPGVSTGRNKRDFVKATTKPVVANAHGHTKAKTKAAAHAKVLGAGNHGAKVGGSGIPGVTGAGPAVNKLLPSSYAETLAGAQFDPQIREATLNQLRQKRDQAQAERDINDWASQVQGSQQKATTRDQAAGAAASGDVKNVIQGLIDSLGGSRGAGVVGAAGVNDLTAIKQQGEAQDTYNNDLAPILANEQATNLSRQRALGTQSQDKLAAALIDLQGQRGQAKAKALTDIIQANNQARQSNFGNRLALENANLAAASLGMKADEFAASLRQQGLSNQIARAKLTAAQQAQKIASGHPNWAVLNPVERRQLADQAVADAVKSLPAGVWDEEHILNSAYANLRSGGYGSARRKGKVPSQRNRVQIIGAVNNALSRARQQHQQAPAA
jgi:hypothetical protein